MDPAQLRRATPAVRGPGQLREGLRHVAWTPSLRTPLLLMVVASTLAYEFNVTLPLLARYGFHGDAQTLGILNSALGSGAVIGGLITAGRRAPTDRFLGMAAFCFGVLLLGTAAAPSLWMAAAALALTGALSITFVTSVSAMLQLRAPAPYRGRIMALWSIALLGTTPIGAPIVGWLAQLADARASLAAGGVATVLAAVVALLRRPGDDT